MDILVTVVFYSYLVYRMHYLSPEILKGIKYEGAAADIFSSGVVLFILLAGCMF